jgi:TatD DNase family protein
VRLIDTHCHLNDSKAFPDPAATVAEARAAGVDRLIVVGVDEDSSRRALEIASSVDGVFAVVGWHPTSAAAYSRERLGAIEELLSHPKAVAVGEVGLDFYWDKSTPDQQYRCLRDHLELAERMGKPVVLHCRDANEELLAFLEGRERLRYLFHCFSGDAGHASRAVALGSYLGVDGPITYPKNVALRAIFADLPRDRIVVETDSPYMAPVPYRGQKNQPAWVADVNRELAATLGVAEEVCAALTTSNAERFFRI